MGSFFIFFILSFVNAVSSSERGKESVRSLNRRQLVESKRTAKDPCRELSLTQLFVLKQHIERKLLKSLKNVQNDKSIEKKTRDRQIKAISYFERR